MESYFNFAWNKAFNDLKYNLSYKLNSFEKKLKCARDHFVLISLTFFAEYENKSDSVFGDFPYRIEQPRFLPGYEWIPKHIDIVGRSTYSFMTVYMSFLFVISTFLNSLVVIATIKNKVSPLGWTLKVQIFA